MLPTIWVVSPSDANIEHVNIWPARSICPLTGVRLPDLCWGKSPSAWTNVSAGARSLPNLLEAVRQVLSETNMSSRAR
jgi:hypothetical protein